MTVSSHAAPAGAPAGAPAVFRRRVVRRDPRAAAHGAHPSRRSRVLATTGAIDLIEPTEARYALIAQEMRRTGDYVTPHLNGLAYYHQAAVRVLDRGGELRRPRRERSRGADSGDAGDDGEPRLPPARRCGGALARSSTRRPCRCGCTRRRSCRSRSDAPSPPIRSSPPPCSGTGAGPVAVRDRAARDGVLHQGAHRVRDDRAARARGRAVGARSFHAEVPGSVVGWALCAFVALPWYPIETLKTPGLLGYLRATSCGTATRPRCTGAPDPRGTSPRSRSRAPCRGRRR